MIDSKNVGLLNILNVSGSEEEQQRVSDLAAHIVPSCEGFCSAFNHYMTKLKVYNSLLGSRNSGHVSPEVLNSFEGYANTYFPCNRCNKAPSTNMQR
jgi:hypothetical protein